MTFTRIRKPYFEEGASRFTGVCTKCGVSERKLWYVEFAVLVQLFRLDHDI